MEIIELNFCSLRRLSLAVVPAIVAVVILAAIVFLAVCAACLSRIQKTKSDAKVIVPVDFTTI
jgi:hypothetical protein